MFEKQEKRKDELTQLKEKIVMLELEHQEEFKNILEITSRNSYSRDDIKLDIIQKIAIKNIQKIQNELYQKKTRKYLIFPCFCVILSL